LQQGGGGGGGGGKTLTGRSSCLGAWLPPAV